MYLVGAGPGDRELLTVKGCRLLACADTVVYDALVDPRLLELCPPSATRLYVGKRNRRHARTQDEINNILIDEAKAGRVVVRLKGGDPFIFGRGGEEAAALVEAGIAFEVVPGVSAGVAVPAYAGIPLTHRGVTAEVVFLTGHESETTPSPVDWTHYAQSPATLVIFMGLDNLGAIAQTAARSRPRRPLPGRRYRERHDRHTADHRRSPCEDRGRGRSCGPSAAGAHRRGRRGAPSRHASVVRTDARGRPGSHVSDDKQHWSVPGRVHGTPVVGRVGAGRPEHLTARTAPVCAAVFLRAVALRFRAPLSRATRGWAVAGTGSSLSKARLRYHPCSSTISRFAPNSSSSRRSLFVPTPSPRLSASHVSICASVLLVPQDLVDVLLNAPQNRLRARPAGRLS